MLEPQAHVSSPRIKDLRQVAPTAEPYAQSSDKYVHEAIGTLDRSVMPALDRSGTNLWQEGLKDARVEWRCSIAIVRLRVSQTLS